MGTIITGLFLCVNASTYNLMEFDKAINNGNGDSVINGNEFQNAINAANHSRGTLFVPAGVYNIYSTLKITDKQFYGCKIEGENTEAVKLVSHLKNNSPVFSLVGGYGASSNVSIQNITFITSDQNKQFGTAIFIDGQNYAQFRNLKITNFNYGIYMFNNQPDPDGDGPLTGSFSEANIFENIWIDNCSEAIRLEQGDGNDSFHGNVFDNCYINIGPNQVGFNHVSGFYYNGKFRFFMWSHDVSSVYINAMGNSELNTGDITFESQCPDAVSGPCPGKIVGSGRFWYNGSFNGIGSINDYTSKLGSGEQVFACNNYWKSKLYDKNSGIPLLVGPLNAHNNYYTNPIGMFSSLKANNIESVILNTYNFPYNGLYLGYTGNKQDEEDGKIGLFLASAGDRITSHNVNGFAIQSSNGDALKLKNDGKLTFQKSGASETSIDFNNGAMAIDGNLSVKNGNVYGYQVISGSVDFKTGLNSNSEPTQFIPAFKFSKFISGDITITAGNQDNPDAPASSYKIFCTKSNKKCEAFMQSQGWNGTWVEYYFVDVNYANKEVLIGTRANGPHKIWYTFSGVIY
jgi:hypothetical protein